MNNGDITCVLGQRGEEASEEGAEWLLRLNQVIVSTAELRYAGG